MNKYILRIDDITPGMNRDVFNKLEKIFDYYDVQPIIGVVPENHDPSLDIGTHHNEFRPKIQKLQAKGWTVAQHGYHHTYVTKDSGLVKINKYSEFAGLPYKEQLMKIKVGKEILERHLGTSIYRRMAPAHSFDENTCKALKKVGITHITDGIAVYPFKKYGLYRLPQQLWKPQKMPFGTRTICLHPNSMKKKDIQRIEEFCSQRKDSFVKPSGISYKSNRARILLDCIFKGLFYSILRIKKLG